MVAPADAPVPTVMSTAIVWFRRDLRVHDHPALTAAHREADRVVPLFVLDPRLLDAGRFPSRNRAWFLLESLRELRGALRDRGGELFVRAGRPEDVLPAIAREVGRGDDPLRVRRVAVRHGPRPPRDRRARRRRRGPAPPRQLRRRRRQADARSRAGRSSSSARSGARGSSFRAVTCTAPRGRCTCRRSSPPATIPHGPQPEATEPFPPGEAAARERLSRWLSDGIERYGDRHDLARGRHVAALALPALRLRLGARGRGAGARRRAAAGAGAFVRQLAWRDFYAHVLLHHPGNAEHAYKAAFEALEWVTDEEALRGLAGGPDGLSRRRRRDAPARCAQGWMHNRARLIIASFLTKDLHLDWRLGEAHFMRHLLCGDEAQNNGNWQWITSIGVDPAPYFRRLYNPMAQQQRHDPDGAYVRRWCPELRDVPLEKLAEPWTMSEDEQAAAGCVIGRDYPEPIVDHKRERERAIERYRAVAGG